MGGHGGLNILPQKSWNVYNRDNRQQVRRDEARAEEEARAAAVAAQRQRMSADVARMRSRATGEPAAPLQQHVNLFAAEEAALGNLAHAADRKAEEARLVARVMPDLQLGKSAREPTPWYLQRQAHAAGGETAASASASAAASASASASASAFASVSCAQHVRAGGEDGSHSRRRALCEPRPSGGEKIIGGSQPTLLAAEGEEKREGERDLKHRRHKRKHKVEDKRRLKRDEEHKGKRKEQRSRNAHNSDGADLHGQRRHSCNPVEGDAVAREQSDDSLRVLRAERKAREARERRRVQELTSARRAASSSASVSSTAQSADHSRLQSSNFDMFLHLANSKV